MDAEWTSNPPPGQCCSGPGASPGRFDFNRSLRPEPVHPPRVKTCHDAQESDTASGGAWRSALGGSNFKCSARSTQPIPRRRTTPQAPPSRIQANADNRKASRPSLLERLVQPLIHQHLPHTRFRAISPQRILVSWFAAKIWPAFRDLWRESGMTESSVVKSKWMLLMALGFLGPACCAQGHNANGGRHSAAPPLSRHSYQKKLAAHLTRAALSETSVVMYRRREGQCSRRHQHRYCGRNQPSLARVERLRRSSCPWSRSECCPRSRQAANPGGARLSWLIPREYCRRWCRPETRRGCYA